MPGKDLNIFLFNSHRHATRHRILDRSVLSTWARTGRSGPKRATTQWNRELNKHSIIHDKCSDRSALSTWARTGRSGPKRDTTVGWHSGIEN